MKNLLIIIAIFISIETVFGQSKKSTIVSMPPFGDIDTSTIEGKMYFLKSHALLALKNTDDVYDKMLKAESMGATFEIKDKKGFINNYLKIIDLNISLNKQVGDLQSVKLLELLKEAIYKSNSFILE